MQEQVWKAVLWSLFWNLNHSTFFSFLSRADDFQSILASHKQVLIKTIFIQFPLTFLQTFFKFSTSI